MALNSQQQDEVCSRQQAIQRAVRGFVSKRPELLSRHSYEDLVQEANAAACAAFATYCQSSCNATLEQYVFGCVKFALLRYSSQAVREFATPNDTVDESQADDDSQDTTILVRLLRRLSKDERRLIVLRYGLRDHKPHSAIETAKKLNVSRLTVYNRQQQIEAKMARMAEELPPERQQRS